MRNLKTKLSALIIIVVLIATLGGCDNETEIMEGKEKINIISGQENPEIITLAKGDTIYIQYAGTTAMFLISKVDMKNRVIVGNQCNVYDITIRNKRVMSFSEYLKLRAE